MVIKKSALLLTADRNLVPMVLSGGAETRLLLIENRIAF